jgi:hypothetical protein
MDWSICLERAPGIEIREALDELVAREGARVGASAIGLEHDG